MRESGRRGSLRGGNYIGVLDSIELLLAIKLTGTGSNGANVETARRRAVQLVGRLGVIP